MSKNSLKNDAFIYKLISKGLLCTIDGRTGDLYLPDNTKIVVNFRKDEKPQNTFIDDNAVEAVRHYLYQLSEQELEKLYLEVI